MFFDIRYHSPAQFIITVPCNKAWYSGVKVGFNFSANRVFLFMPASVEPQLASHELATFGINVTKIEVLGRVC